MFFFKVLQAWIARLAVFMQFEEDFHWLSIDFSLQLIVQFDNFPIVGQLQS